MSEDTPAPPAPAAASVQVDRADNVNVAPMPGTLPHAKAIISITFAILTAFVLVTFWVLTGSAGAGVDAATKGAVIQTWNNLAIAAGAFWLGSSLSGKMTSAAPRT